MLFDFSEVRRREDKSMHVAAVTCVATVTYLYYIATSIYN